jgi:molybdenum cofactor cytidylyltransferase
MGRSKLSLPFGNSTVLQHVVASLRDGGADVVLVVIGPHLQELVLLAESAGAVSLLLTVPTADMRETLQAGLRWLDERHHPRAEDSWLLAPGDCPAFAAATVGKLLAIAATDAHSPILIPAVGGRRGHPTLFPWKHAAEILRIAPGSGVDSFVRRQTVREVMVDDPGILCDLDTPADYDRHL